MTTQILPQTKQEYYDLLVRSAYDGTFPSIGDDRTCRYREDYSPDCKKRCAVGLLILDEDYSKITESAIGSWPWERLKIIHIPNGMTIAELSEVQKCHDYTRPYRDGFAPDFVEKLNKLECFEDVIKTEPGVNPLEIKT
jgi:hypothetical protein